VSKHCAQISISSDGEEKGKERKKKKKEEGKRTMYIGGISSSYCTIPVGGGEKRERGRRKEESAISD